jgi:hypothetical protein
LVSKRRLRRKDQAIAEVDSKATLEPAEASGINTLKAEEECSSSRSSGLFDIDRQLNQKVQLQQQQQKQRKAPKQQGSRAKAAPATYASGTPSPAANIRRKNIFQQL